MPPRRQTEDPADGAEEERQVLHPEGRGGGGSRFSCSLRDPSPAYSLPPGSDQVVGGGHVTDASASEGFTEVSEVAFMIRPVCMLALS